MVKILILICAAGIPHSDCTPDTARAVIQGGESIMCATIAPQAMLAATSLRTAPGEYVLVRCEEAA